MKMKYLVGALLSFMISLSAFAQNSPGADYLSLGETKLAKEYFTKNTSQNPEESHYYLGEIAFKEGNMAEAKSQYEQSAAANAELGLGAVGLAKLQLKSNQKAGEDQLKEVQKKNKKNSKVLLAIANAYFDNGLKDKATSMIAEAKKADNKSPYPYILEGDMLAKENNPGGAAGQYDQAIYKDANCVLAYMKGAKVYEYINRNTAADLLKKAIAIKPEYKIANKDLADLYYRDGFYPDAIAAYKEFFAGGDYTIDDITRYAASEYFTKGYSEAKRVISEGLKREPNNFVLNRLLMYTENDTKNYNDGLVAGNKFFSVPLPSDTTQYLVSDYMAYANILSETGDKQKSIEQYKKAIELDPSKVSLIRDIATTCAKDKMYAEAASYYKEYIKMLGDEKTDATDYYTLGSYYLSAGANVESNTALTPEEVKSQSQALYKEADAAFAVVAERKPDSYLGFYQRARTNYQMDPDSELGLAKPFYEETVKVLLADPEPNNKILIEAYSYLSYYYYLQYDKGKKADDKLNVKNYAEKILELDPENGNGQQLFDWASAK
ncbi:hypothetical protein D0T84_11395 [Dysgonomonas sp. 521]|uniref:tetratricopeptide repeat protein n=1 Tax=Dysgonomonas sp. 521 TaxID=2302932 RepID=UPI0013D7EE7D|nr:tetratricopeptide repeat protein [Dysgonomonas sp. 521]NDV95509.1 hypothetical protein [Dysgonomonas sp. 521]